MTSQINHVEAQSKPSFLPTILRADGVFALVSAAATIFVSRPLAELIALKTSTALVVLGFVLLGYGAILLYFADRQPVNRRVAQIAIILNMLWVIDSYAGLLLGFFPVNTAGKWVIAFIAEVVFVFGILEIMALRRSN